MGAGAYFVFVGLAGTQPGDKKLPDAATATDPHRMTAPIPVIEITDYTDTFRGGGPDAETYPVDAVDLILVCTEYAVNMPVPSFSKQVQVEFRQLCRETVRVIGHMLRTVAVTPDQPVMLRHLSGGTMPLKQVGIADTLQRGPVFCYSHPGSAGDECPHQVLFSMAVFTEQGERVMVACFQQPRYLRGVPG